MADLSATLQFEIYDQLATWFRVWYSYSTTVGMVADEYKLTGNINERLISKEDLEHLTAIRENIEYVCLERQFSKEVEGNLLALNNPNSGVYYLNKLAKLINPYIDYTAVKYLENTCNTRLLINVPGVNAANVNAFLFEVQQFSISFGYIEETILRLLSESVWYQQYIALIKVEGYSKGVAVANDFDKVSAKPSTNEEPEPIAPGVKLQWNCSPAIAGYIITELVRAGYIEPPKTHGELSYAKLAGICSQLFDIRSDGKPTTLDYLKKVVNPESNPLPDYKRAKLNLPDLDQLT